MQLRTVVPVTDNQIILSLPQEFRGKVRVVVIIEDEMPEESYEEEMKRAMKDPRFLADMNEVMEDFKYLDGQDIHE